jgi:hypothetical protein
MAGWASSILEAVAGVSRGFEGRSRERKRGGVARAERGGDGRACAHQQELAEEVVEFDRDSKPAHRVQGDIFKEDDVLDRAVLLADDRGARLLENDHEIPRPGGKGERHSEAEGRDKELHAPAGYGAGFTSSMSGLGYGSRGEVDYFK